MKQKKDAFDKLGNVALGVGVVGLATGVGSAVAVKAGVPGLTGSFNTISSFTGIAVTAYGGKTVLQELKKIKY